MYRKRSKYSDDGTVHMSLNGSRVGIGILNPLSTLHINATDGIILPVGDTATTRPTADTSIKGMIRSQYRYWF